MDDISREEQYIEFRVKQEVMGEKIATLEEDVKRFYDLLKAHMDEESQERKALDKRMQWMLGFIILNALGQGGTVLHFLTGGAM